METITIGIIGLGKLGSEILKLEPTSLTYSKSSNNENNINDFDEFLSKIDVIIDCSTQGFDERASKINKPIVIATTQKITKYPNSPFINKPNGSNSWNLLSKTAIELAKTQNYNFLITDIHHQNKLDNPSGTARKLINELKENGAHVEFAGSRGFNIVGIHSITAYNEDEVIKIEHQITNRAVFAKGLILEAKKLITNK